MLEITRSRPLGLLLWTCALSGCASAGRSHLADHYNNLGLKYLEQAGAVSPGASRDLLCEKAEESCSLSLEYGKAEHPYNCLGLASMLCERNYEKARGHFKEAIAINVDFAEAHNNLGVTFLKSLPPKYGSACEAFTSALEIDPGYSVARENLALCFLKWGNISKGKKKKERFKNARRHLIRLLEIGPNYATTHARLGFLELQKKRYDRAEGHLKQCISGTMENNDCYLNLGHVYMALERCDEAIVAYHTALRGPKGQETKISATRHLQAAYDRCAKQDGAIVMLLEQIKRSPTDPGLRFDLAKIYADRGLHEEARRELSAVTQLDRNYCPAHERLAHYAHRRLDTGATIAHCRAFVGCAGQHASPPKAWQPLIEQCRTLVRQLSEPIEPSKWNAQFH